MRAFWIAFSMYSRIKTPNVEWDKKSMGFVLCWFPAVGIVVGGALFAWLQLAQYLNLGAAFTATVAVAIPILISGGIHMDGFCDTVDALSSQQSRERKLEILKDSHAGAFAIIFTGVYLLLFFGVWTEAVIFNLREMIVLCLIPVFSRSLSGLFVTILPNARGTGLLASFSSAIEGRWVQGILVGWTVITIISLGILSPCVGGFALVGAVLTSMHYITMSQKSFGGITGDLAGYFLQLCELGMTLTAVIGLKIGSVL